MVSLRKPTTLVKTGIFNGDLESSVKKFNSNIEYLTLGFGNTNKYAIFDNIREPYLFIIAQQKDKIINPNNYNTSLSITSNVWEKNLQVYNEFKDFSGISLEVEPSEWFKQNLNMLNLVFPIFEKNPKVAMEVLRGF